MATQITSKHGFTDNFWLQMAVIVTLVVIALAAAAKILNARPPLPADASAMPTDSTRGALRTLRIAINWPEGRTIDKRGSRSRLFRGGAKGPKPLDDWSTQQYSKLWQKWLKEILALCL